MAPQAHPRVRTALSRRQRRSESSPASGCAPRRSRRLLRVLAALVVVTGVAGCATIPTSGPVRSGEQLGFDRRPGFVRALPAGPRAGANPVEVVRGFLQASASIDGGLSVANEYLTPEARRSWDASTGITIYTSGEQTSLTQTASGQVTLSAVEVATVDPDGVYTPRPASRRVEAKFKVVRQDREWRIAALPDGLLMTDYDVSRSLRSLEIYYLGPGGSQLVPDPVFLPAGPGLATTLVKRLLRGPSAWLRSGVSTAVPEGTLLAGAVLTDGGVAQVDLTAAALRATPEERAAMSAQIVFTLAQVDNVNAVAITANGAPFTVPYVSGPQQPDDWSAYDPNVLPRAVPPYVIRDGLLGTLNGEAFTPVPGPLGQRRLGFVDPAISQREDRLAVLTPDHRTLLVGSSAAVPEKRLTGGALSQGSWDPSGRVWVADRTRPDTLWVLREGQDPQRVLVSDLDPSAAIRAVAVSRDGSRVALVVTQGTTTSLVVGSISTGDTTRQPRVDGLRRLAPDLRDLSAVHWVDASTLVVLGQQGNDGVEGIIVGLDGQAEAPLPRLPGIAAIASAPSPAGILAATGDGHLYRLAGRRWLDDGAGSWPVYPG